MGKLKKRILLFIFIVDCIQFSSISVQAQNWPKVYRDNFNATMRHIEETYDHGFLLSAYTYTSSGWPLNEWIIKININGNVLWDKQLGNGIYSNGVTDSKITIDNGIILAGSSSKYSGNYDPIFIKLDVCGDIEWCKVFKSPDQNYGTGILQLNDGTFIGMLQYFGEGETYARISLVKLDQTGEPLWIQKLAQEDTLIYNEEGRSLLLTYDSNYLVTGNAYHPGKHPFWIMTDTTGVQVWDLYWNGLVGQAHNTIEKDTGTFYSTCWGIPPNGKQTPYLLKFERFGNPIAQYPLMGDTINYGSSVPIACLNDTTLVIGVAWKEVPFPVDAGFSEVFITDTLGNLLNRRLLITEYATSKCIIVTSDNKIVVSGNYFVYGNLDIYLWKMNSNLEDDTLYTQPINYDSLCPHQILSDTVDLDCSLFVNIDEIPTKEVYESTIKISPNPGRDWIALTLPDIVTPGDIEMAVYNIFGVEIIRNTFVPQNRTVSLNISGLSSGLYLAVCRDSKRKVFRVKFIVAR